MPCTPLGVAPLSDLDFGGSDDELLELPIIKTLTNKIIELSNELNPYKGITYNDISKYSFNKYSKGDFLDWHPDNHEIINGATITYIIQLNDEYDGGELQLKEFDFEGNETIITFERGIGNLFVFLSSTTHRVAPIIDGNRYSLVSWFKLCSIENFKKTLI